MNPMDHAPLIPPGPGNPARRIMKRLGNRPALRHAVRVAFMVAPWRRKGLTLRECCARLHAADVPTFRGRAWTPGRLSQVLRTGRCAMLDHATTREELQQLRPDAFPDVHKEEACQIP